MTYQIQAAHLASVEKKVQAVNKRLAHFGYEELVELINVESFIYRHGNTRREAVRFDIKGARKVEGGWEFLAVIDHDAAGNLIMGAGEEVDAKALQFAPATCDHCGLDRNRKTTVLVRRGEEVARVGSTCVNAYLDCDAAIIVTRFIARLDQACRESFDEMQSGGFVASAWGVLPILEAAAMITDNGKGYDLGLIKDEAASVLNGKARDQYGKTVKPSDDNKAHARKVYDWAVAEFENATSNYGVNVNSLIARDFATRKHIGLVGSLIRAYAKAQEKAEGLNEHYGTKGDREVFELTLAGRHGFHGYYGWTNVYKFNDAEGRRMVWFTGKDLDLEVGEAAKLKGTIKKHDEYRGTKQTVLTRCKLQA